MIAIIDIVAAALFGVAVAMLFEGRWGPVLATTPAVGLLHGVLMLIKGPLQVAHPDAPWLKIVDQIADPWMLVAAMVASATGSVLAASMLIHQRESREAAFWLPDMDQPKAPRAPRAQDLTARLERAAPGRARRLVEEGYAVEPEPEPEFQAAPTPGTTAATLMKAREKAPEIPAEANKRREPRRRTLLTGRLFTEEGVSVACVIRDLSTNGAAVKLQGAIALPRLISLIDISNGIGHQAQVRWRFRDLVGLRFLRSYDLSSPGSPEAASLAHRWASLRA